MRSGGPRRPTAPSRANWRTSGQLLAIAMAQLARLESGAAVAAQPAHAAGVHVQASRDASGFENLAYYTIIGTQDTDYTIYLIGPDRALATRTILSIPGAARDSPDDFTYMFQVCLVFTPDGRTMCRVTEPGLYYVSCHGPGSRTDNDYTI